jgi:succinoglycan biosynthesis protein ExoA
VPPIAPSIIMTVRDEPMTRMRQIVVALGCQAALPEGLELVIAARPADLGELRELRPQGAVTSIVLVENGSGSRSTGLNLAAQAASGVQLCRLDARSRPGPGYVATCVARLNADVTVGVVGAPQRPFSASASPVARGIARCLSNPWALGGAAYRRARHAGPVDTAYLGTFRRSELLSIGGYDEQLEANEDYDLCQRYRRLGLAVVLDPELEVTYEARGRLIDLYRQYFAFGRSKVVYWRRTGTRPNARQSIALAAAAGLVVPGLMVLADVRRFSAAIVVGTMSLLALDTVARSEHRDPVTRLCAIPAYLAVFMGWLGGIVTELPARPIRRVRRLAFGAAER